MGGHFFPVPDWCSWENQGVAVALADVTGNGRPDLIVLLVDRQPGHNQGLYRMGHDLTGNGEVSGGWEPWRPVPDWVSAHNEGAALAVADLSGTGRPDLLVFTVHTGPGARQGLYRVGRDLDEHGEVAGGWGPWCTVPPWFSWDPEEGCVALLPQPPVPQLAVLRVGPGRPGLDGSPPASAAHGSFPVLGRPRRSDERRTARGRAAQILRSVGSCLFDGLQVYGAAMLAPGYPLLRATWSPERGGAPRLTWAGGHDAEEGTDRP
jgi:hypothetical protein